MVLLENMLFERFGWVGSECVFGFCWGSVNEWMRKKKKMDWGEGRGGLCRVGRGFERVGGWMGIDLLQTIDHALRGG